MRQKYRHSQKYITSQIRISPQTKGDRRDTLNIYIYTHTHTYIYIYIYILSSHFQLLVKITTKHRKLKRLPFKCHYHHGESTLTIERTPQPQKRSPPDLPANTQSNFIIIINTQYVKRHI